MKRLISPLSVVALSVLAFAGTPCKDPLSADIVSGRCAYTQCYVPTWVGVGAVVQEGYVATNPSTRQGGCKEPGHNSVECQETTTPTSYSYADQSGTGYNCTNGQFLTTACTPRTVPINRTDGHNTTTPCDYCRTTP